jgi:hypothetical protein
VTVRSSTGGVKANNTTAKERRPLPVQYISSTESPIRKVD